MISLEKIKKIASTSSNEFCIIEKGNHYTWYDIYTRTKSRVAFLKTVYSNEQLSSACYLSKNNAELICWLAAFATLGIPVTGLDYSLSVDKITTLIKKIKPAITLVSFNLYSSDELNTLNTTGSAMLAIDTLTDPMVKSIGENHVHAVENILSAHIPPPFRAISLTSGTSSLPKIAFRYRSFDTRRFDWFTKRYGFDREDGFMLILPLYHAAGNGWARMFMGLGSTLYIIDQDDENDILSCLIERNVTASVMTPILVNKLTRLIKNVNYQSQLRWVLVGGSYFSVKNKQAAIRSFGSVFYEYYGCTESGVNVLAEPEDILTHPKSVGKTFDGNHVLILDENNIPVTVEKKGRIAVASYMLMDEYSDGTRPFIIINNSRYFLMADYGFMDKQNRLFLMNRNGNSNNKDYLYEIEECIRCLPGIDDAALISVVENGENKIKCIYSINQGDEDNFERIVSLIKQNLRKTAPVNIKVKRVNEIPYSPSGKVRVKEVEDILLAA